MGTAVRDAATFVLVAALLVACASTESSAPKEGQVVLQAGPPSGGSFMPAIVPGEDIRRLAVLIPEADPAWRAGWVEGDSKQRGGASGAHSGLMTGLMIVQSVPFFIGFWPAAVGVVVGTTAMGAFGAQFDSTTSSRMTAEDRATILQAIADLRPDQLLRDSTMAALQARTGRKPLPL